VPMLCLDRFHHLGWPVETIALAGAGIYLVIRFGLGKVLKKYTVHRGMFHSIPAAAIAGEVAFLVCASGDIYLRAYKACAVVAGFMSHLILDEIWSVRVKGGRIGLKSSSGTAMKLWGESGWANLSCYGKLILLGVVVLNDPIWSSLSPEGAEAHSIASRLFGTVKEAVPQQLVEHLKSFEPGEYTSPQLPATPQYGPMQANAQQPQYGAPQYVNPLQYVNPPQYVTPQPYAAPYPAPVYTNPNPNPYPYTPPMNPPTYTPPYYGPQSGQNNGYEPIRRY
jgi:hypothetical protein